MQYRNSSVTLYRVLLVIGGSLFGSSKSKTEPLADQNTAVTRNKVIPRILVTICNPSGTLETSFRIDPNTRIQDLDIQGPYGHMLVGPDGQTLTGSDTLVRYESKEVVLQWQDPSYFSPSRSTRTPIPGQNSQPGIRKIPELAGIIGEQEPGEYFINRSDIKELLIRDQEESLKPSRLAVPKMFSRLCGSRPSIEEDIMEKLSKDFVYKLWHGCEKLKGPLQVERFCAQLKINLAIFISTLSIENPKAAREVFQVAEYKSWDSLLSKLASVLIAQVS